MFSGPEEFVLSALVLSAFHDPLLYRRSGRIGLTVLDLRGWRCASVDVREEQTPPWGPPGVAVLP